VSDEDKVRDCFRIYKKGILQDDQELVMSKLHQNTFDYFDNLLFIIKEDDSTEISRIPPYEKLVVLLTRHIYSIELINKITGKELYKLLTTKDYVKSKSISNLTIGEILITKNKAKGNILIDNSPSLFHYNFYKTNNEWSIDLTSQFDLVNELINYEINDSEKPFINQLLSTINDVSSKPIDSTIWIPTDLR